MKVLILAILAGVMAPGADVLPKPIVFTREQITVRIATLEQQRDEVLGRLNAINGAIADYKYLLQTAEESAKTPKPAEAEEKK